MIAKALAQEVLATAMSGGADFVELFGEITRNNSINMVDGKIDRATDNLVSGVGIRAFLGTKTVFASTSDTSRAGLLKCARSVAVATGDLRAVEDKILLSERMFPNIHPAKIFMGDTGSLTIGILLSFFSIELSSYCSISEIPDINFFIVAFSPLVVPCFDVVRVFILRVRNGKHPFKPDRSHIHHKLLNLGISQRWVMVLIIALSLFYVLLNMLSPFFRL